MPLLWTLSDQRQGNSKMGDSYSSIGISSTRWDLTDKVTGKAEYSSDISLPNMLYGRILRSPHPHAIVRSIDSQKASSHPGIKAVLTPFNVPTGKVAPDVPILDTKVRFVGDEVAAVAAETQLDASEAITLINVEYEKLSFCLTTDQALSDGSEPIHGDSNLVNGEPLIEMRGNVEEGFDAADFILEESFSTPGHSPAPIEPRSVLAHWNGTNLTIWKSSRGIHSDRKNIANALDMDMESVRVIGPYMGGGYGGKDETRISIIASLLSIQSNRPVRLELTREEEFVAGRRRHATTTTLKMGVKNSGDITAIHATTVMNTGAYLSSGPGVARRAGQGALYLYRCPNVRYEGYLVYTNTPTAGSYRALGAPQGHFALESVADKAAEKLGIDPLEFRLRNHVGPEGQPGERTTPLGEVIDTQPVEGGIPFSSNGLRECLEIGSNELCWWQNDSIDTHSRIRVGKGMSMFLYRGGPGSQSNASISMDSSGIYKLSTGYMDVGEGSTTVLLQIAAEVLCTNYDSIEVVPSDTDLTPDASLTAGSTVTFSGGLAVKAASEKLRDKIISLAAAKMGQKSDVCSILTDKVVSTSGGSVGLYELLESGSVLTANASVEPGSPDYVVNSFGAHFVKLSVDIDTGKIEIMKYVAVHDSGRIINPRMAENQVKGGISQMLGFALLEDVELDPSTGILLNSSFLEHKSPTILDSPDIDVFFTSNIDKVGPYGAKSLGEPPSIGPAPAIANAIYQAVGVRINELPITPDKLLNALVNKRN